jgi:hypothetical protein
MDYTQYEPPIVDGIINYGEMHAKRRADSIGVHRAENRKVTQVYCKDRHLLAIIELAVYENEPVPIIIYWNKNQVDASLLAVRKSLANDDVEYITQTLSDFLYAGDDLDLEAKCKCGGSRILDRLELKFAFERRLPSMTA